MHSKLSVFHFQTFRKHDRKGIARKVSNFSEADRPSSPDYHIQAPEGQPYPVPLRPFPVHGEVPIEVHPNGFPKTGIRAGYSNTEVRRAHSKGVAPASSPNGSPGSSSSPRNMTPPTMVPTTYPPMPVISSVAGATVHPSHLNQISGPSAHLNHVWNGPRFASVRMDGALMTSQAHPNMENDEGSEPPPPPPPPPPLLVHLKERGEGVGRLVSLKMQ